MTFLPRILQNSLMRRFTTGGGMSLVSVNQKLAFKLSMALFLLYSLPHSLIQVINLLKISIRIIPSQYISSPLKEILSNNLPFKD